MSKRASPKAGPRQIRPWKGSPGTPGGRRRKVKPARKSPGP